MHARNVVATAVLVAVAGTTTVAAPAQARLRNDITVSVSDRSLASGQTFRIRGRFIDSGRLAVDNVVKVQTRRNHRWVPIRGARVRTNDRGRYRMRLILSQPGWRLLRVVGVDQGPGPNCYQRFRVRVH
jgi:hypothetical protein